MNPELVKKALDLIAAGDDAGALELLKEAVASAAGGGETPPADDAALAEPPDAPPAEPPAEPTAAAVLSALSAITGKASAGEAVAWLRELSERVSRLDGDRAELDLSSRRELIADLIACGVEFPATAWEGEPAERKPVARLAAQPLAELRKRVALVKANRPRDPKPPVTSDAASVAAQVAALSAAELAGCKRKGLTPEQFVVAKANAVRRN